MRLHPYSGVRTAPPTTLDAAVDLAEGGGAHVDADAVQAEGTQREELVSLGLIGLSAICYSLTAVCLQVAHEEGFPSVQLATFRGVFAVAAMGLSMLSRGIPAFGPPAARKWVVYRGLFGGVGFVTYFHAAATLPLGDAVSLMSVYPVISVFMGWMFLNERMRPLYVAGALACALGAVAIAHPSFIEPYFGPAAALSASGSSVHVDTGAGGAGESHGVEAFATSLMSGYIAAAVACLMSSVAFIFMRLAKEADAASLVFGQSLCGLALCVLFSVLLQNWVGSVSTKGWVAAGLMVAIGLSAHTLLNYAARTAPAGLSAIMCSTDIFWAYLYVRAWWCGGFGCASDALCCVVLRAPVAGGLSACELSRIAMRASYHPSRALPLPGGR
jgi:drug/metabolite transporter (DMT)-like permease